ncbi:MAG: alpha/beta fold hydrolase [Myxococcota bacterium]
MLGFALRSIELTTGRIAYLDEGEGAPIVLLHGAPFTSLGFVRVIRELRMHHRVLAPDLPGFGYSHASPGFSGTLESHASFVEEFCRALSLEGIVFYLNDSSGSFGIAAAARMAGNVAGLVVADTVPIPLTGPAWAVKLILKHVVGARPTRWLNRRLNLFAWLVATVAPWLRPFPASERRLLVEQFDTAAKRDRVIDLFDQMGRDDAFMHQTAALARERLAKTPTLILYGQFDPMRLIGGAARFRRLFPNSVVRIIPLEEHFPILSSGERVARLVLDWLATPR